MSMKLYRAILHTAGKTDEQIKAGFTSAIPTQKEIELARAVYNAWDGLECLVGDDPFGRVGVYSFFGAINKDGIAKEKEATYLMEQDEMFGTYIDQREEFDRDFDSGEYSPAGSIAFQGDEIEIIEECKPKVSKLGSEEADAGGLAPAT